MPVAQAPQFGAQPPGWSGPPQNSGKAIASLICGVVFFFWPLSALAAVILGHLALSDIKRSAGRLAGRGMAIGGLVTGYIGVSIIPFLIIAAIAIPNLLRSRTAANEASAVGSLRTYNTAMITYSSACPDIGYPTSLESLGPGGKDCSHMDLVSAQLASRVPVKSGYRFIYTAQRDTRQIATRYEIVARPVNPGATGVRQFFTDESGVIRFSINGNANADSDPLK
jgi:type II secretory pathway pseudopilin PulG